MATVDVQGLNIALLIAGGLALLLGLLSNPIKSSFLSEPMIALLLGLFLGPAGLALIRMPEEGTGVLLEQGARLTLAIGLMGVALRLPKGYVTRYWRTLAVLLGVIMPAMWISSGVLVHLILGLPFLLALLLGAILTPTDPVLASSIVTGREAERNLPESLRNALSAESGTNDGLAYPFVFFPILVLSLPVEEALGRWVVEVLLREVAGAVLLGIVVGYTAGRLLEWAESKRAVERTSFLAYTIALSLVSLGVSSLIGSNGILAVFVAGLAFAMAITETERHREERVQEAVNRFFILPIFVLLGLVTPWDRWLDLGWEALALVAALLVLRRIPWLLAVNPALGGLRGFRTGLFMGWFGPMGVAALYYAVLSQRLTGNEEIWAAASLVICASVLIHGLTATPFGRLYARFARRRVEVT